MKLIYFIIDQIGEKQKIIKTAEYQCDNQSTYCTAVVLSGGGARGEVSGRA